jgi:hypothetical protein
LGVIREIPIKNIPIKYIFSGGRGAENVEDIPQQHALVGSDIAGE